MSLYELESLMRSLAPPNADLDPTDDEWEEGQNLLAAAVAHLPDVRL
jgi:exonuclease VII small subunit